MSKVVSVKSWILRLPFLHSSRDFDGAEMELIGVTLSTDEGVSGTGWTFTSDFYGGASIKALIDEVMLPEVLGSDLIEHRAIWERLAWRTHRLGRGVSMLALAAVDIALWDAMARSRNLPLADVIGRVRSEIPAYGSGAASPLLSIDELVATSVEYVEQGFAAIKIRIGRDPGQDPERIRRVREAVGPDVRLMCDANERLDLAAALSLGHRLAEHEIFWFEEPVRADHIAAHQQLAASLPMPIAVGEHLFNRFEFVPYIDARAAAILQPDVCMVGGVSELIRIGELAGAHGLTVAPHFMTELHVHLAAALPACSYVEYFPFLEPFVVASCEVRNGHVIVPDRPGHGVEFRDDTWERYQIA